VKITDSDEPVVHRRQRRAAARVDLPPVVVTPSPSVTMECPSCGETFDTTPRGTQVYCDDLCKGIASSVRWYRGRADRCVALLDHIGQGRTLADWPPDLAEHHRNLTVSDGYEPPDDDIRNAAMIQLLQLMAGGYFERLRRIPAKVRADVVARDNGRCIRCGEPGTEIDHIAGSSSAPTNLQLLCHTCHVEKTGESIVWRQTTPAERAILVAVLQRVFSPEPLRPSDAANWNSVWRTWLAKHRH
jgi:hypothetical protein